VIPVYSLLLVCVLPLQHAHETAGALGIRHSPRPLWGDRFFNGSGAWRGEIVKVCLQTMRLFENEFGVGAERGLRSRRKPHPSCPDLIRASINLRNDLFRRRWITGSSSPVMTISMGMTVCRGAATRPSQLEERRRMRQVVVEARRVARLSIRSAHLTIFWHCGHRYFSFRTGLGASSRQRTVNGFGRRCASQRVWQC
jgi:hypothetical protein